MSNYNAKKKPELEALLKERGLPHTGNKADLVARLQEDDAQKQGGASAEAEKIDWDDDGAAAPTAAGADTNQAAAADATTSEAGAAALAAGGRGAVANPVAVPNQTQAEDPAADDSLTVKEPGADGATVAPEGGDDDSEAVTGEQSKPKLTAEELAAKKAAEEAKFKAGLAASSVDAEAEKRRRRAERFGIQVSEEETKKDERAKRFGAEATLNEKAVSALDSALPEREQRKRGRERADVGASGRGDKRVDSRRRQGGGRRDRDGAGGNDRGFNNQDRAALQKRLDRFGGSSKASAA